MNGELWEGWEASEERKEAIFRKRGKSASTDPRGTDREDVEGVLWLSEPPPGGLAEIGGGTEVETPLGRKILVGMPPGTLSEKGKAMFGHIADVIIDRVTSEEDKHHQNLLDWTYTVFHTVKKYESGEDTETMWKLAHVLADYENAMKVAEEKGYHNEDWHLSDIMAVLHENVGGGGPEDEEVGWDEEEEEEDDPLYEPEEEREYHPMIDGGPDSDDGEEYPDPEWENDYDGFEEEEDE